MILKDYLEKENHTQQSFIDEVLMARNIRIPQSTLAKWISGIRIPRKEEMITIFEITGVQVQPNDFYGIDPANIDV